MRDHKAEMVEGDCWKSSNKPNKEGGYVQLSYKNEKVVTVHKISYLYHRQNYNLEKGLQISHLCGVPNCWRPDHLTA